MKKILIVDDSVDLLDMLVMRFNKIGFETHTAQNGEEALTLIRNGLIPHIIIVDEMMPVMDGFQFVKKIKSDEWLKEIPIIVLTAREATKDAFLYLKVNSFMTKPFDAAKLIQTVNSFISINNNSETNKPIILIASDSPKMSELILSVIDRSMFEIDLVQTGEDIIKSVLKNSPLVIILPCLISDYNVSQLIKLIHRMPEGKDARIFVFDHIDVSKSSAELSSQILNINKAKAECIQEGITDYIPECTHDAFENIFLKHFKTEEK